MPVIGRTVSLEQCARAGKSTHSVVLAGSVSTM